MRKVLIMLAGIAAAAGGFVDPALADEPVDYWSGAYVGFTAFGFARGSATIEFKTDGPYNNAAGDTFILDLPKNGYGAPLGFVLGYHWVRDDRPIIVGVEASFNTMDVVTDNVNSPDSIHTGDHQYHVKTHWLATLMARVAYTRGPFMLYLQGGPALGHPVTEIRDLDNNYYIWHPQAQLGVSAGTGFQVALGPSLSFGLGYRGYILSPAHVTGVSLDRTTDDPVPGTETDHTVQIMGHSLTARFIYRFGQSERLAPWDGSFEWGGFYLGAYAGALHQIGLQAGYDSTFGRAVVGVSGQAGIGVCCGLSFDFAANVRAGWLVHDLILAYGEVTGAYQTGTFFGVVDGFYYGAGAGIEIALSPRVTGFMEVKAVGYPGAGLIDANFQGGFNFYLGPR